MELLPEELRGQVPKLYATKGDENPMVWVKFVAPGFQWAWYIIEVEEVDELIMFYGWIVGSAEKQGRFVRSDPPSFRGYYGLTVQRDSHFAPCRLSEVGS